ncbi:MAG: cation transporter [Nocardioides sp.]
MTTELPVHWIGTTIPAAPAGAPGLAPSPERKAVLIRRVRLLVAFTIAYNVIEAAVALTAGSIAGSAALLGFGLDSVIEVSSALAVAWQFAGRDHEARERVALQIIACSFFGLAVFVTHEAGSSLIAGRPAEHSSLGIGIAALSLLVMPVAWLIQRRTGTELGSYSAVADSKQTLLCTYMSAVLLLGLLANSVVNWWWADSIAALFIAALAAREGVNAWRGDLCCSSADVFVGHDRDGCKTGCDCC